MSRDRGKPTEEQQRLASEAPALTRFMSYEMLTRRERKNEEFIGDGILAAVSASRSFDPSRGIKWSTYACQCIANAFVKARRKEAVRRKRMKEYREHCEHLPVGVAGDQRLVEVADSYHNIAHNADAKDISFLVDTQDWGFQSDMARRLGVTPEAVRQRQLKAIGRVLRSRYSQAA